MYGHEKNHIALRQAVVSYMFGRLTNSSLADMATLCQYYADVMTKGQWVGKDVITMMAEYLRREIHVFMYVGADSTSPMKYFWYRMQLNNRYLLSSTRQGTIAVCRKVTHLQHAHEILELLHHTMEAAFLNGPPGRETSISPRK